MPTKKSRLRLGCWVLIKDRYNNDKTECPRGEIGRHKGLKILVLFGSASSNLAKNAELNGIILALEEKDE